MARSCGIHIDQRRFHVVALDGNPKKHRVVASATGEIPYGDDPVEAVSEELRAFARKNKLNPDAVQLAVDSGMAAFRSLTVPFDDRAKIEDILKFEVESDLPQWDIDEVIVDYLVMASKPGVESQLLVTAIPKSRLERQLLACERGGLEANDAELDGSALFEAAHASGCLHEGSSQVLVHVGDSSTTVAVVDSGRLAAMRAIRAGAGPHADVDAEEGEGELDPELGDAPSIAPAEAQSDDELAAARRARLEQTAKRIRRELGRTVSGVQTSHEIEAIYFCGHPLETLMAEDELFGVPVRALEAVPGAEADEVSSQELTIAYGAALRALGGGELRPHLRREELAFSGKFERLELPLAVFALLLCTLLGVKLIVTIKQIDWRDEGLIEKGFPGDMQIWMEWSNAFLLPQPDAVPPYVGRLKLPDEELLGYIRRAEAGQIESQTKFQELSTIRTLMNDRLKRLKTEIGVVSEVTLPQSALHGSMLVMGKLEELREQIGRFGIRSIESEYKAGKDRAGKEDRVEVRLDIDFFADTDVQAAQAYTTLMRSLKEEVWCDDFEERQSKPFPSGGGLAYEGLRITVNVAAAIAQEEAERAS